MAKNDLLTIYGARISKDGKHANVTLIRGEEDKEYFTTCVALNNTKHKTQAKVKDGYVLVKIPLLKDFDKAKNEDTPF